MKNEVGTAAPARGDQGAMERNLISHNRASAEKLRRGGALSIEPEAAVTGEKMFGKTEKLS